MTNIDNAGAAGLHYAVTDSGLTMHVNGQIVLMAHKPYQLIAIANDCISGLLRLDINGDPVQVVDHRWLLRLAGQCCAAASEMWPE